MIARLIVMGSALLIMAGLLEIGTRLVHQEWRWTNFLRAELEYFWAVLPSAHDPLLGWIPREHSRASKELWGKEVTILKHGIRSNGEVEDPAPTEGFKILAVGDSFTFGDEVSDGQTWPAFLQSLTGLSVLNAGVFGYGVDQTFLRARRFLEEKDPDLLIFGLIPDNIRRCELAVRSGVPKPYFKIEGDQLVLQNIPISERAPTELEKFKQFTNYSFFFYKLMRKTFPRYWLEGSSSVRLTGSDGLEISCRLIEKLAEITRASQVELVILVQYERALEEENLQLIDRLRNCLSDLNLHWVDLKDDLLQMKQEDPEQYKQLYTFHMTPAGNEWTAKQIQDRLFELSLLPSGP